MEPKKNPEANLENFKPLFFLIGLVVALGFVLQSFELQFVEKIEKKPPPPPPSEEAEELIPVTREEIPPPPPPPKVKTLQIEVVDDDTEIEDDDLPPLLEEEPEEIVYADEPVEEEEEDPGIFMIVEDMPEYPGGNAKLFEYLQKSISYPKMAKEAGIQGKVYVKFIVEPSGKVTNVELLRGIGGGCDEEAMRVVRNMASWKAGKQRGKPVRVEMKLPINFTLR